MWMLHNTFQEEQSFFNIDHPNYIRHFLESGVFETTKGMTWKLKLLPGNWPNFNE